MSKVEVLLKPGRYVLAISGGVDSMVLLDVLRQQPDLELVVAHYDHGIRLDSAQDRQVVQAAAGDLVFYFEEGNLGAATSEASARDARYAFLEKIRERTDAQAIITAHHQDDLLETALLNLERGTARRGLSSLQSQNSLLRPLLNYSKQELLTYAKEHGVVWREDSTNQDPRYRRNYIRQQVLPQFQAGQRQELLNLLKNQQKLNQIIDLKLASELQAHKTDQGLDREWFVQLPHVVAKEIMACWLREEQLSYDAKSLDRLVMAAKTSRNGHRFAVNGGYYLVVKNSNLALTGYDR